MLICVLVVLIIFIFGAYMIYMTDMTYGLGEITAAEDTSTSALSLTGGNSSNNISWLHLSSIFDDTINEYSKSVYNYCINKKYLTIIGETHDNSECGLINFNKLGEVNRNVLLVFEDTNNERMDITFQHPFGIHYRTQDLNSITMTQTIITRVSLIIGSMKTD